MRRLYPFLLVVVPAVLACDLPPAGADGPAPATLSVTKGDLTVLFRDNSQSPELLSGIDALHHRRHEQFDAFDPDTRGASAGLNFEHIISGHRNRHNKFTPRHGRMTLVRDRTTDRVSLVRNAADSPWRVASELGYTVRAPHAIDFDFRCRPTDASLFGERGYAIFFFACLHE